MAIGYASKRKLLATAAINTLFVISSVGTILSFHFSYVGSKNERLCTEAQRRYSACVTNITECSTAQKEHVRACYQSDLIDIWYIGLGILNLLGVGCTACVAYRTVTVCRTQNQNEARSVELASVQEESHRLLDAAD